MVDVSSSILSRSTPTHLLLLYKALREPPFFSFLQIFKNFRELQCPVFAKHIKLLSLHSHFLSKKFFKKSLKVSEINIWVPVSLHFFIVRTYVFHLLGTYVTILCNWLILWQNAFYLYLVRFRMCLIFQETCCLSLVLKPWRLDQETNEEKLFIKSGQIAQRLRTDSSTATRHLSTARLSIELFNWLLSQSRHLSIVGGSIKKALVSSIAPW